MFFDWIVYRSVTYFIFVNSAIESAFEYIWITYIKKILVKGHPFTPFTGSKSNVVKATFI